MKMQTCLAIVGVGLLTALPANRAAAKDGDKVLDPAQLATRIDQLIEARWKEREIKPAPLADDSKFLRRLYLDLVGRIPAVTEARDFLKMKDRQQEIKRLLDGPLYITHLSTTWKSILLPPNNNQQFQFLAGSFKTWLDKQIKDNTPYDKLVRDIITVPLNNQGGGRGGFPVQQNGPLSPVGFFQANELKPENIASSASRIFLGVKLECAQCHDHPFAKWSRDQFWQYAAFFSGIQQQQVRPIGDADPRKQPPRKMELGKEIKIGGTEKVVQANFLDGQKPKWRDNVDARVIVAEWMTSPENPYFARTAVNRVWAHFFGLGLIDPVDDEPTDENPISHPELLAELTQQFIAHKFDVKYLIRAITMSKTYQRTSVVSHESQNDPRAFARMSVKGLTAEQLFDSLAQATCYLERGQQGDPRVVVFGGQNGVRGEFLSRFASQDKRTETHTSILQALALMNGKFVADATKPDKGNNPRDRQPLAGTQTLGAVLDFPGWTTERRIETLFLAALSRQPRPDELKRFADHVARTGDEATGLGDVFWVLLNSSEFMFNH
jgi:Protein of unknown function (DUF1549)/Protein of unknown function (DUF1553)